LIGGSGGPIGQKGLAAHIGMIDTYNALSSKATESAKKMAAAHNAESNAMANIANIDQDSKKIILDFQNAIGNNIECNGCKTSQGAKSSQDMPVHVMIAEVESEWANCDVISMKTFNILQYLLKLQIRSRNSISEAEKQSLAKSMLIRFAWRYMNDYLKVSHSKKPESPYANMFNYYTRFLPVEEALENADYLLAMREIPGIIFFLPIWHEIICNNFIRIFNKYLNTNFKYEAISMNIEHPVRLSRSDIIKFWQTINVKLDDYDRMKDKNEELIAAYDFFIIALLEEFRAKMLTKYIMGTLEDNVDLGMLFPEKYIVDGVLTEKITEDYNGEPLSATDTHIVSYVWSTDKIANAYLDVKQNEYIFDNNKCESVYYPEINMCAVANGFHHAAMASALHSGSIAPQKVCSLSQYYKYVRTDGINWINIKTNDIISEVYDFRIAAIYELCRRRHEISQR
jgi:hypothetical protein